MSQKLSALRLYLSTRRRLIAWYQTIGQRYWRLSVERDEINVSLDDARTQLGELREQLIELDLDLLRQRGQHATDLVLLGRRTRALMDVSHICDQAAAAGVTSINLAKVHTALGRGW